MIFSAFVTVVLLLSKQSNVASAASSSAPSNAKSRYGSTIVEGVKLPSIDNLRVRGLGDIVPAYNEFEGKMFAGQLPIDHDSVTPGANVDGRRTGNYQFWLFVPDHPNVPETMVSWFNGGPGCSSFATGNLFEHGPVTVPLHEAGWCCEKNHEALQYNPFNWATATVMLYIEQPLGVGFSEATNGTPPPSSEDDVAADMDSFMQNFYKVFGPDSELDLSSHRFYLVGESYAGTYIPSIGRGMYLRNVEAQNDKSIERIQIPLTGIAIGNGVIDAITQSGSVIDWSWYHGLIDAPTRDILHSVWEQCIVTTNPDDGLIGSSTGKRDKEKQFTIKLDDNTGRSLFHPFNIRDDCGVFAAILHAAGDEAFTHFNGPNIYEYSTWDTWKSGEGDKGTVGSFYNDPAIQRALNVPDHRIGGHWQNCIPEEDEGRRLILQEDQRDVETLLRASSHRRLHYMDDDKPWDVTPYIAQLLDEAKIDVLIYSGDRDIICNTQGNEEALMKMEWSGNDDNGWSHATRSLWVNNDYPAGYIKSDRNLHFLIVYNAGHMVPYNQPENSLDMLERFLRGTSFHDKPLMQLVPPADLSSSNRTHQDLTSSATVITTSAKKTKAKYSSVSTDERGTSTTPITVAIASFLLGVAVTRFSGSFFRGSDKRSQGYQSIPSSSH